MFLCRVRDKGKPRQGEGGASPGGLSVVVAPRLEAIQFSDRRGVTYLSLCTGQVTKS